MKEHELSMKASTIDSLFWIGIRDSFSLWSKKVGVRIGYKIVVRPDNTEDSLPPFLRGFLLGGPE